MVWCPRAHFPRRPGADPWRWRRRCRSSRWSSGLWRQARSCPRSSQGRGPAAPAALERPEARAAALAELRPENLLLAAPQGCSAARPQRLLLVDFGCGPPRPPGRPRAAAGPRTPRAAWPGRALGHVLGRGPGAPGGPAGLRAALGGRDARRVAGAALETRARAAWPRSPAGVLAGDAPRAAGPAPSLAGRGWGGAQLGRLAVL